MTLQELYREIDGSYEQAKRVLMMDKLIEKHIRKLPTNTIFTSLSTACDTMDPKGLFESAHAIKGVCSNLGLIKCAEYASKITEEYREGNTRKLSDEEVKNIVGSILEYFNNATLVINKYISVNS